MPTYTIQTKATATIEEIWRVEADTPEDAEEALWDGKGECVCDYTTGNEEDREIIETFDDGGAQANSFGKDERVKAAAPAMLAALQTADDMFAEIMRTIADNDSAEAIDAVRIEIARAIAAATGEIEREG